MKKKRGVREKESVVRNTQRRDRGGDEAEWYEKGGKKEGKLKDK